VVVSWEVCSQHPARLDTSRRLAAVRTGLALQQALRPPTLAVLTLLRGRVLRRARNTVASPTGADLMYSEDSIKIELAGAATERAA
jgi:hypothetical protein